MGIQQQDPEYLRAKCAFIRDLIQFHESRGTGLLCDPKINGKEVDLYLLYQIVTSHGGWEKINLRNEWDKLLEHFKLPRSTNGGLAIKQIYLRYLELYEKIHYLGEDIDNKEEAEDDYLEDFRGRRRYPNKLVSSSHHGSSASHHHPPKEINDHNRSQLGLSSRILDCSDYEGLLLSLQSPLPNEQDMAISVCTLLSNETKHVLRFSKSPAILNMLLAHAGIYQDCGMRLLMEETYKDGRDMNYAEFWDEVLHQPDSRQLLCECFVKRVNASLGLTDDEGAIISQIQEIEDGELPEEEKYSLGTALRLKLQRLRESRLDQAGVEEDEPCASNSVTPVPTSTTTALPEKEEAEVGEKMEVTLAEDEEKMEVTPVEEIQVESTAECVDAPLSPKKEVEEVAELPVNDEVVCNGMVSVEGEEKEGEKLEDRIEVIPSTNIMEVDDEILDTSSEVKSESCFRLCCSSCPCQRTECFEEEPGGAESFSGVEFSLQPAGHSRKRRAQVMADDAEDGSPNSLPFTLARANQVGDKVGQRICQIAHILRNLSFEQDNAIVMARSPTLMRFLLVAANCTFGSLAQTSFDIIGNISSYIRLEEPLRDPISSLFLTLVTSSVFSTDRFKILRSLESLRELTRVEGNEGIITRYIETRVYRRMCDLLTLSDIMLLIYTLECILSMTGLGEAVCDEIVRVQGSVATLVSLVTVEAQSYGPKGCILMRVVETVTGTPAAAGSSSSSATTSATPVPSASSSSPALASSSAATASATITSPIPAVHHQPPHAMMGMPQQAHPVAQPIQQTQHLLQQVLQQPPNPIYAQSASGSTTPARPSPASSPGMKIVSGTTTVVPPVAPGQTAIQSQIPPQQQPTIKSVSAIPAHLLNPASSTPTNSNQVFSNLASSTNLINHLNSPTPGAVPPQGQFLPGQHSQVLAGAQQQQQQQPQNSSSALPTNRVQIVNSGGGGVSANDSIAASIPPPPPPGATIVVHQQQKMVSLPSTITPTASAANNTIVATMNGGASSCLVTANLPQIANHNMNQHHVVTPSISLVTPRGTLSEEAWSIAWLKGTFESATGTSIEQGEIYRMYSAARKNPAVVLSLEQFVQCVKCAYGANVGPVIKQFGGGTSLPFFEGIKPKIAIRAVAVASPAQASPATIKVAGPGANAIVVPVSTPSQPVTTPSLPTSAVPTLPPPLAPPPPSTTSLNPTVVAAAVAPALSQDGESNALVVESGLSNCVTPNHSGNVVEGATATVPVSVHIPSMETKPSLSPILQATLSQPPKPKTNAVPGVATTPISNNTNATGGRKRCKSQKLKESKKQSATTGRNKKQATVVVRDGSDEKVEDPSTSNAAGASDTNQTSVKPAAGTGKGKSTFSPASSAIRSLLASKVVQRQQNKLQQQVPKGVKSKLGDRLNSNSIEDGVIQTYPGEIVKVNGVGPEQGLEKIEESSASSSLLSSDGSDNSATKATAPITSFHGVLHNGQANADAKNELILEDDLESLKNKGSMKGMLIDLLERRVPSREPVNGIITGREIRISDKGLELIDKMEDGPVLVNHTADGNSTSNSGSTCTTSSDLQDSQKMTFYSSTSDAQVTLQGQASSSACVIPASAVGSVLSGSAITLASGGGGGGDGTVSLPPSSNDTESLTLRTTCGQQVKICSSNFLRLLEPISEGDGAATIATAAATTTSIPANSTSPLATIAQFEASSSVATTATATTFSFVDGDGLVSSCSTASSASCSTVVATTATAPPNGDVTYFMSDDTVVGQIVEVVDTVFNAEDIVNSADIGVGLDIAVATHDTSCNVEIDGEIAMVVDGGEVIINSSSPERVAAVVTESNALDSNGDGDLLDKFDEFSDLIVVPPEQLAGLKRPSSPLPANTGSANNNNNNNNASTEGDDVPPPAKKMAVDRSLMESEPANGTNNNGSDDTGVPVIVSTCSVQQPISNSTGLGGSSQQVAVSVATSLVSTPATPSLPPGSGAQVVQLPLRLSVNPQNPQQLTFTRQLVLPSGQQLLLSTGNSQSPLHGQMIISKSQGAANDQMPKAIIILQQPQQQQQAAGTPALTQPVVTSASIQNVQVPVTAQQQPLQQTSMVVGNTVVPATASPAPQQSHSAALPPNKSQVVAIQQQVPSTRLQVPGGSMVQPAQTPLVHNVVQAPLHHAAVQQQQQIQLASPQIHSVPHPQQQHPSAQAQALATVKQQAVHNVQFEGIRSSSFPHLSQDQLDLEFPFLCEWAGCGVRFLRPQQVSMHALKAHCPETMLDAVRCEWGQNGCDPLLRKRFSLMTHLQDRHCSKQALEMALYRRKNKIEPPPVPQQPVHHPGYAPNAAFHAIKRHAMSFMSTKEHLHDDNEGPVTKSIRLTSALILRNLVNYSSLGRRMLQGYESHLSAIAMSNVESSRTIAQLLHDMNDQPKSSK